ncbi:MAG: hypothetical protein RJA98_3432, partial [Pseudomonadota bacterium]
MFRGIFAAAVSVSLSFGALAQTPAAPAKSGALPALFETISENVRGARSLDTASCELGGEHPLPRFEEVLLVRRVQCSPTQQQRARLDFYEVIYGGLSYLVTERELLGFQ